MSLAMPLPPPAAHPYPLSRSSTPGRASPTPPSSARIHSRPPSPPPGSNPNAAAALAHTISAPPTPVNTTHLVPLALPVGAALPPGLGALGMERCRSSEAVLSHHAHQHTQQQQQQALDSQHQHQHPHQHVVQQHQNPVHSGMSVPGVPAIQGVPHDHERPEHVDQAPINGVMGLGVSAAFAAHKTSSVGTVSADATPRKPHPLASAMPNGDSSSDGGTHSDDVSPLASPGLGNTQLPHTDDAHAHPDDAEPHVDDHDHEHDDVVAGSDTDERMDIDEVEVPVPELGPPTSDDSGVWGMPKWGLEDERPEVRPGVRLVGMEELPALLERHSMLDTPSQVVFPWLHGISDDGAKGREMGAFFGYGPPFEPPPYRGLMVMLSPPHPFDRAPLATSLATSPADAAHVSPLTPLQPSGAPNASLTVPREHDEPESSSSSSGVGSYKSSGTEETAATSPTTTVESIGPDTPTSTKRKLSDVHITVADGDAADTEGNVAMHPCEPKRVAHSPTQPMASLPDVVADTGTDSESDDDSYISEDEPGPSCLLLNAVHAMDIFHLPMFPSTPGRRPSYARKSSTGSDLARGRFRPARLPNQINLRNLHIQQIKYATVSDIILYARNGVGPGVLEVAEAIAQAQEDLYRQRMDEFYSHIQARGEGEGIDRPVKYGVWVLVEPFTKVERFCPELVNLDSEGNKTHNSTLVDLFEREAYESRQMTRATEVVEGFWVGNDTDVPGGADDGAGATVPFSLCVRASECSDMPTSAALAIAYRQLVALDRARSKEEQDLGWATSPATLALRNLLSPTGPATSPVVEQVAPAPAQLGTSPDETHMYAQQHALENHYVALECAGSCRTITGHMRNLATMADMVVELVTFLRKIVEGRDKTAVKHTVLVHCQDGYTESSIIVLSYIMASLGVTLPEAYLHLQLVAQRSFFLYPSDRPLLHRIEARLASERRDRALKAMRQQQHANAPASGSASSSSAQASPTTPSSSLWKTWGFIRGSNTEDKEKKRERERESEASSPHKAEAARRAAVDDMQTGSQAALDARVWFDDKRFDGFPSRILSFLYLGNLEHAGNAAMLRSLGISHVVSVGESLLEGYGEYDPQHGYVGRNTLAAEARAGRIQVLDLTDVRDDGNDPLRPVIARACEWMEQARAAGGKVLVHCRVGVSRSASIVMAYLMKYQRMGLMDAYLVTRARRLNVLIQPNLRFFHELFGWEAELARTEAEEREARRREAQHLGVRDPAALALLDQDPPPRRILYSWPTFCRDVHCLNRRFLCN